MRAREEGFRNEAAPAQRRHVVGNLVDDMVDELGRKSRRHVVGGRMGGRREGGEGRTRGRDPKVCKQAEYQMSCCFGILLRRTFDPYKVL